MSRGSCSPRQASSWAKTAGTPAARSKSRMRCGSGGWMRQCLAISSLTNGQSWRGRGYRLLFLFRMERVFPQAWGVLAQLQLFAPRLAADGVVVVSRLLAHEEDGFDLFLALSHGTAFL